MQHWQPPELVALIIQDAHHAARPAHPALVPLRLRMSREKSLDGCNVVARIDENATVVTHTPMPCRGTAATLLPGTPHG